MSFNSMARECAQPGIPKVPLSLAQTKINEALGNIYDETDWSFQTQYAGWNCPGLVTSTGTFTVTPYSNQVVASAAATAVLSALTGRPLLTELQYRDPSYSLYNIIAYDLTTNAPFATLTLDRPWMEPTRGAGQPYMIYQAYFPVPVSDFRKFIEIRDTTNDQPVDFINVSQDDLSNNDAQRQIYGPSCPTFAVPYGIDMRPNSATLGNMMYEIWPHNLSHMPYSFSYNRRGTLLVNGTDLVQPPLTEDLVKWRAKELLYQWKESQKQAGEAGGADWKFLSQAAQKEYLRCLKQVRAVDANLHRNFMTRQRSAGGGANSDGYSNNRTGTLNIGSFQ